MVQYPYTHVVDCIMLFFTTIPSPPSPHISLLKNISSFPITSGPAGPRIGDSFNVGKDQGTYQSNEYRHVGHAKRVQQLSEQLFSLAGDLNPSIYREHISGPGYSFSQVLEWQTIGTDLQSHRLPGAWKSAVAQSRAIADTQPASCCLLPYQNLAKDG